MNYKIVILALAALQAHIIGAQRPCVCGRNLREVCGSDGVTYANECILECKKITNTDLTKVSRGRCKPAASQECITTLEYKPVCGTDGETYPNRSVLDCKLSTNPGLAVAHDGACQKEVACVCTEILEEVCGSDGKTYANPCLLNCETAKNNTLSIAHSGKCESVKVADIPLINPACICTRNLKPVCGSDGRTYSNECLLNCASSKDNHLTISHEGECGQVNVVDNASPAPANCICTRNLKPVCGSNGETYNNQCLLECAGQTLARSGPC